MDAGIDWFTLALTVPLVPTVAIVGALFWLRTARPKFDESARLDDPPGPPVAHSRWSSRQRGSS